MVEAVTMNLFETISCGIDEICALDKNPIEELFAIKDFVMLNLKNESTSPIYQLQKLLINSTLPTHHTSISFLKN